MNNPDRRLRDAIEIGDAVQVKALLEELPDLIELIASDWSSAIHYAASQNHATIIHLLLDLGCDINSPGIGGRTPLHTAAWQGSADAAFVLIARGAQIEALDSDSYTPLFLSLRNNGVSGYAVLGMLLERGASLDIFSAIGLRQTHVVHCLLMSNPQLMSTDPNCKDFVSLATALGSIDMIKMLLQHGADLNSHRLYRLPLIEAMSHTYSTAIPLIQLLTDQGADVNWKKTDEEVSPLEWATANAVAFVPLLSNT